MTISTDTATASYTGNGTTTAFPIPFYFLVDTDVKISKKDGATGTISVLTLNSDYTLTGAGNQAGGTATMTVAPLGGTTPDQLFIERNVDAVQETAYPENGIFPAASHEKALDRLTMLVQQILSKLTFGLFRDPFSADYSAANRRLTDLADGRDPADAVTLQQLQLTFDTHGYATKADMDADLSKPDGSLAQVTNDPTTANNQSYRYDAATTTWVATVDRLANALGNGSGFQSTGAGAVLRDLQSRGRDAIHYGDHATLQQSLDEAYASGLPFIGRKGVMVTLASTLKIQPSITADFQGMNIVAGPSITSGNAVEIDGGYGAGGTATSPGCIKGLRISRALVSNHADPSSNVDGLSLKGGLGQVSGVSFYDLHIMGFRDNLRFDGPNCYLNHFYNPSIGVCWRRSVAFYASANSGENFSFFGGSIYNANNASFNAAGLYIDPATSGHEIFLHGTSIDYCDQSVEQHQSVVNAIGCHFENNNNNPHVALSSTSSKERTTFIMRGGSLVSGPLGVGLWTGIPGESAGGRPAYITTANGSCNVVVDGTKCGGFITSAYVTELLKNTDGIANRRIDLRPVLDANNLVGSARPMTVSNSINLLYLAANGSATGWTSSLSDNTLAASTSIAASPDTGSRQITCTSGNSGRIYQDAPCNAGQTVVVKTWIQVSGLTGGYAAARVEFLAADGTVILNELSAVSVTTNGVLTEVSYYRQAPSGTRTVRVSDYIGGAVNAGLVANFSNEHLWVF